MKNVKMRVAITAVICIMVLAITPMFFVGALKTRSLTMRVGDDATIELTNPILQMFAQYDAVDGNAIATEKGGKVEAYAPGETEVEIKVPFRTMKCKVYVLGFTEDETTLLTNQTVEPEIAGQSDEAQFYSSNEEVVDIVDGKLVTLTDGDATIVCEDKGIEVSQNVQVAGILSDKSYVFEGNEIQLSTNDKIDGTPTGWTSADANVATVDESGKVTGVKAGSTTVSCQTGDGQTLQTTVNVVGMKDSDLLLLAGEEYSSPLISGEGFDAVGIEWKSADSKVVRVDSSGNMKAVKGGETQITGSIDGQTITGNVNVLTMPEQAFTAVGMNSDIQVSNVGDNSVTWTSSDESKVKVENGVLKGVGTGTATITATAKDKTLSCDVSVVQLSASSLKMEEEDTKTLEVTGIDEGQVSWSSADESIATVDEDGEITPVSVGSTVVYCSIGDSTMSVPVTIEESDLKKDAEQAEQTEEGQEANKTDANVESNSDTDTQTEDTKQESEEKKESSQKSDTQKDTTSKIEENSKKSTSESSNVKKSTSSDSADSKKNTESKKSSSSKSTVENTSGQLTGAEAMVACGNYYASVLDEAVDNGEKWVYSNSDKYVAQSGTFEKMLSRKIRGGNCASIANWAFRDMGIISNSQKFYGDGSGKIRHYNSGSKNLKSTLDKSCDIIDGKKKSFGTLVKEGKVKVGDVIIGKGHTFVYRGNGTVFASGHDAKWHKDRSVKTEDSNKAVFESWIRKYKGTYDERFKVCYIIRIKDSFVPKYYRDENGNLVKNR